MDELISQLLRLYLPTGAPVPDGLEQHLDGRMTRAFDLAHGGAVRAIVIPFDRQPLAADPWERLCGMANALQGELGLPAPAVSISGASGFRLWLSFAEPVPAAIAQEFLGRLVAAYCPSVVLPQHGVLALVELPPCLNGATGKWAAFIHPGMGASFADEPALEMPPPPAAQAAFLQGLESISQEQFRHALAILARDAGQADTPAETRFAEAAAPAQQWPVQPGLLLKDATLEDIVRHLHAKNIEPTFRHLLPPR